MMNKNIFASISIIILAILGVWYFAKNSNTQNSQNISTTTSSSNVAAVKIGKILINAQSIQELQSAVDQGHSSWHLDPKAVAIVAIYPNGLAAQDSSLELIEQISLNLQTGIAVYLLPFAGKRYEVTVIQPTIGKNKIWVVSDIEYADQTTEDL